MDFFYNVGLTGGTAGVTQDYPVNFFSTDIDDIASQFITQSCSVPFDVKTVIPNWLVDEHDNGNTNLIKFFQHYYDWLYCNEVSGLYTDNINQLQNLENVNSLTVNAFNNSFVPQLGLSGNIEETKKFLNNYRRDIVSRKGTPEGAALFFTKIFPEVIEVQIEQSNLTETITLGISGPAQDESVYKNAYNSLMKPVGIQTNFDNFIKQLDGSKFEFEAEDAAVNERLSGNTGFDGATAIAFEVPTIGNYLVYNMGDTATIDFSSGCSGTSHPRGITPGNTSDMPTYTHPRFQIGPKGASFGNINIYEFLYMPYTDANKGITPC